MRRSAITVLCATCLLSTSAYATGYGLREFSASSLGTAYAGAAANGRQASTMIFNPALLADVDDFDFSASAIGILPATNGTFTATTAAGTPVPGTGTAHDIVNTALVPSFSVRKRLSDQFTVGLAITSPWGMITDYADNWVGRYYATMSNVKTYNITPMVAYQPTPEISIGVGVQVEYIKGTLGKAIDFGTIGALHHIPGSIPGARDGFVLLKADDWSEGYILGVAWKPSSDLSLGLSYRSRIYHTLGGNETFTLDSTGIGAILRSATGAFQNTTAQAKFTPPAVATFGARWQVDNQWTAQLGVDWTDWSAFNQLLATSGNPYQPADLTVMKYQDSWLVSLGVEYKPIEDVTLRLGTAYDQTPTLDEWRTPGIPDSNRRWLTGGIGYRWNEHMDVDFTLAHMFCDQAAINLLATDPGNEARGALHGVVNMDVTLVGVEFSYH